jgi:hypothetical protein
MVDIVFDGHLNVKIFPAGVTPLAEVKSISGNVKRGARS